MHIYIYIYIYINTYIRIAGLEQAVSISKGCGTGLRVLNIAGLVLTLDLLRALAAVSNSMYACMHVCMYAFMCVSWDTYIDTHTHTQTYIFLMTCEFCASNGLKSPIYIYIYIYIYITQKYILLTTRAFCSCRASNGLM